MKRAAEGGGGNDGGKRLCKLGIGVPRVRHAFKALVPDGLTTMLLGSRGSFKDQIQSETGTKLVFSNRGEYFPESSYRVLGIYADDMSCIDAAFGWIVPKIVELAEEERRNPPQDGPDLIGKEPGEYVFRLAVIKRMSSRIIGPGGINIKQIRHDTGAKVFIENDTKMEHQLVRVIGQPQPIMACLARVNAFIQEDCDEQDFFPRFASFVNFSEFQPSAVPPAGGATGGFCKGKGGKGTAPAGDGREARSVLVIPPSAANVGRDTSGAEALPPSVQEDLAALADTLSAFPPGTLKMQYSVASELPAAHLGMLFANEGEYVKQVAEDTATNIDFEDEAVQEPDAPRPMTIVGGLLNAYTAHAMVLVKLRAAEAKEREEEQRQATEQSEDPEVLKARIQELQAQLAKVSGKS